MANILSELKSAIEKKGSSIAAGSTSGLQNALSGTIQLQFPSARADGNDGNTSELTVTDLYKNGLLFTAYDYSSRTSPALTSFRKSQLTLSTVNSTASTVSGTNKPVANILLPRSRVDVDNISHKFNDVGESVLTKGNNTISGAISNVASTAVFGMLDSITSGIMADHNEQIYTTARSMYAGPENRTKTYRWVLTPRTIQDLVSIIKIHKTFSYYSYGAVGNSQYAKQIKNEIDSAYNKVLDQFKDDKSQKYTSIMSDVTSFLTNVIVVANPTIWVVKNFGNSTSFDQQEDVFGPCQIQSISFDKAPDGEFNGLSVAPNMASSYVLEITMREILTLSRSSLYSNGVS